MRCPLLLLWLFLKFFKNGLLLDPSHRATLGTAIWALDSTLSSISTGFWVSFGDENLGISFTSSTQSMKRNSFLCFALCVPVVYFELTVKIYSRFSLSVRAFELLNNYINIHIQILFYKDIEYSNIVIFCVKNNFQLWNYDDMWYIARGYYGKPLGVCFRLSVYPLYAPPSFYLPLTVQPSPSCFSNLEKSLVNSAMNRFVAKSWLGRVLQATMGQGQIPFQCSR